MKQKNKLKSDFFAFLFFWVWDFDFYHEEKRNKKRQKMTLFCFLFCKNYPNQELNFGLHFQIPFLSILFQKQLQQEVRYFFQGFEILQL